MKRFLLVLGIVVYIVAIPFAAPYLISAILGFSGELSQGLVFWSIISLPWLPVVAWIILHLRRRD